jgi:hypothetical protein
VGLFKDIAIPLVARNVPVIPLRPKTKIAFLNNWQEIASTDLAKIEKWDDEYSDANAACVAFSKPDGIWFLEIDRSGFVQTIEEQTGQKIPDTFMVRSSPGRGHFYFKQTPASIRMGNLQGKDENGKEAWSARVDNRYVVAPGSYHPTSGKRYETLRDSPIIAAPDWLIQWCSSQKTEDKKITASVDGAKIPRGLHDTTLTSIGGKLRQDGLEEEAIYNALVEVCEKRCEDHGTDYREMCRKISKSVCRYAIAVAPGVVLGGRVLGQPVIQPATQVPEPTKSLAYPVFPRWVMKGTSIYDGLVGPICEKNSRYPEFMFMPAVALMLNYVALKVRVEYKNIIPSFYMVLVGQKGRVIKSSSVADVIEYLHYAGMVDDANASVRNAEGKSLVFTAGSPEGLGLEMSRTNCKNAVLYYDELSLLTSKAGIEGSSLLPNLLAMHESKKFSNTVKGRKESFNFEPGSYCATLIACTTDKNFHKQWSKMSGESSGMDDRFFFLYQPEILAPLKPYFLVNTKDAALETRKRVDKAVQQGTYSIGDSTPLEEKMSKLGNRGENRAEKLALYFAIDLGRDEIDGECIERAIAICEYEISAKKYLRTFESTTREGVIQNEIIQTLQRNSGSIPKRDLERIIHPIRYGTSLYNQCYFGLMKSGYIIEQGTGVKNDPLTVILMRDIEEEEG